MKINEVIRKYRKEVNLTQEQVANYLGVTAPAVNKWENGISYPDITLLAPLARVLKIDVDTLLSFHEELTEKEINQLVKEISECIKENGYAAGFKMGEDTIKEYPNCDILRLHTAELLNAYLTIKGIETSGEYETKIIGWYEVVLTSADEKVVNMAKASLVTYYMNKGEYEKAQLQLDEIQPFEYDKRLTQAILYEKQSRNEDAYEIYENMLYKDSNQINCVLQLICHLLCTEKRYTEAENYANLAREIALLLELGEYTAYTPNFLLAVEKQDKEQGIEMLGHIIDGIETFDKNQDSKLYSHIKFNKSNNSVSLKNMLRDALKNQAELDYIRDEPKAKKLFKRLEEKI